MAVRFWIAPAGRIILLARAMRGWRLNELTLPIDYPVVFV